MKKCLVQDNFSSHNVINYLTEVKQLHYVLCVSLCTGMYSAFCFIHEHLQPAPQCVNTH